MPSVPSILNSSIKGLHNNKLVHVVFKELCVEVFVEKVVDNFIRKLIQVRGVVPFVKQRVFVDLPSVIKVDLNSSLKLWVNLLVIVVPLEDCEEPV